MSTANATLRRELAEALGRAGDAEERAARYEKALRRLVEAAESDDARRCATALAYAREALR